MSLTLAQTLTYMDMPCWQLKASKVPRCVPEADEPKTHEPTTSDNMSWDWDSIELLQSSQSDQKSMWCIGDDADYANLSLPEKQLLIKMQSACHCAGHPIMMFKDTGTYLREEARYHALQEQMQLLSAQHYVVFNAQWAQRLSTFQVQVHQLPELNRLIHDAVLKKQTWQQLKRIFNL